MKLIDLIEVTSEDTTLFVWAHSADDRLTDVLVGIESNNENIDPKFFNSVIEYVSGSEDGSIDVTIDYEATQEDVVEM